MPPAESPLTPRQLAEAEAIYRGLLPIWQSGHRKAEIIRDRDGGLGLCPIEQRIDVVVLDNRDIVVPTI